MTLFRGDIMKFIIKETLKCLFKISAITYPFVVFSKVVNISDEITIIRCILAIIYSTISIMLFNWCYEEK